MNSTIAQLAPIAIWKHFYDLTQIPRPSGHEKEVIAHIEKFAKDQSLDYTIDEVGNLIVRKKASSGKEEMKTVILQSHVDMVPQKNSSKEHDFLKDPIETVIDGDWVRANDTTLGADNGIGIAAAMAVLESDNIAHGPVEALFTISEETGMDGAFGLKEGLLNGKILLNLDSEEEGELFIGCAGGVDLNIAGTYKEEEVADYVGIEIKISGLKGGHSGLDINLGRANASLVLLDLIRELAAELTVRIHSFSGGNLRNAIPREALAVITLSKSELAQFETLFGEHIDKIKDKFASVETEMEIIYKEVEATGHPISSDNQKAFLDLINKSPNGVIKMSEEIPGIVQTSNNIAVVNRKNGRIDIKMLLRSSSDSERDTYAGDISGLFRASGYKTELSGAYPGWLPNNESEILLKAGSTYENMFSRKAKIKVIHAGLECGIIAGAYPDLDMLSFGPTIKFPHSPDEKVHIESVGHFWEFLKQLLEVI